MTNKIALIACSHGLGHVRRMVILARALVKQGMHPTLFAPKIHAKRFIDNNFSAEIVDFDTRTKISTLRSYPDISWTKRLPSLDKFNIVISDNLVEILEIRPDAILSGSFLWHDALTNMHPCRVSAQKLLLEKHFPLMITNSLFAMPEISVRTRAVPLPFFGSKILSNSMPKDILIASGRSGEADDIASELIHYFLKQGIQLNRRAHIEPTLMPKNSPNWMVPASFNDQMYKDVAAALIRPGIGTITNALLAGCRIFPFYEQGNREMAYNAKRIQDLQLGQHMESLDGLFKCCIEFLTSKKAQIFHRNNVDIHIEDSGETAAAKIIVKILIEVG